MYRNEAGLFYALEVVLKAADQPLTCVQIYEDNESIRKFATSPNRVSDYLGGLWRKGQVTRSPAPKANSSSARWAYSWKGSKVQTLISTEQIEYQGKAQEFINSLKTGESVYKKPGVEIFDNGKSVTIELPNFTITVRHK